MRKFTSLNESYKVGSISLSYDDFKEYQNLVKRNVDNLYSEKVNIDGLIFVARQDFDTPNRMKSIINYANSNILLCSWIVDKFRCSNKSELFDIINKEASNLFLKGGQYFNDVINKLTITESYGVKNEEYAAKIISDFISKKGIDSSKVYRTETDCRDDLLLGIDLYFTYKDHRFGGVEKKITCQVKPLKSFKEESDKFVVVSSGKLKPYSVHYLIFVDAKSNKYLLFRNKGATYKDNIVNIPSSSLVIF